MQKSEESSVNNKRENAPKGIRKLDTGNLFSATPEKKARDFEPEVRPSDVRRLQAERAAVRPEPEREQPVLRAVSIKPNPPAAPAPLEALDKPAEDTKSAEADNKEEQKNRNSGFALRRRSWQQRVEQERKRRETAKVAKAEKAAHKEKTVSPTIAAETAAAQNAPAEDTPTEQAANPPLQVHGVTDTPPLPESRFSKMLAQNRKKRENAWRKDPERTLKKAAGYAMLTAAALSALVQFIWTKLPLFGWGVTPGSLANYTAANIAILLFAVLVPLIVFLEFWQIDSKYLLGGGRTGKTSLMLTAIMGAVSALGLRSLHNIVMFILSKIGLQVPEGIIPVLYNGKGGLSTLIQILLSALIPAILTEVFFRGLIQSGLAAKANERYALFFTVVLSGLFIYRSLFWIVPCGLSLISGQLRKLYASLKPSIIYYLSAGTVLALLQNVLPRFTRRSVQTYAVTGRTLFYASIVVLIICVICINPLYNLLTKISPQVKKSWRLNRRLNRRKAKSAEQTKRGRFNIKPLLQFLKSVHWSYYLALLILLLNAYLQAVG